MTHHSVWDTPRCSVCKTPIKELPTYEYCECEHCEGHQISGYKMGCEHYGAIDLPDVMRTINTYRGNALDDIIRSFKEDRARQETTKDKVRADVEPVIEEVDEPSAEG